MNWESVYSASRWPPSLSALSYCSFNIVIAITLFDRFSIVNFNHFWRYSYFTLWLGVFCYPQVRCIENPGEIMSGRLLPVRTQRPCPGPRLDWNLKSLLREHLKRPIWITAVCPMWQRNQYKCNALLKSDSGGKITNIPSTDSNTPVQKEQPSLRVGLGARLASFPTQYDDLCDAFTSPIDRPSSMTPPEFKFKPVTYSAPSGEKGKSTFNLDNIRPVVSIDQEGFRSINPSFKFLGYHRQTFDDKR